MAQYRGRSVTGARDFPCSCFYKKSNPRLSYTDSAVPWFRMARSRAMMVATAPSILSVDFSLSGLMLPAGSVRTKMLSIIHRRGALPPWAMRPSSTSFISSLLGGDISLKPCPKGTMVKPASSRFWLIWTAPHRS